MRPQPRVQNKKAHEHSHHGHTGSPGIPRAMVLTVSFALSPVTGLVCHRRRRTCIRELDASVGASGPHDFAVREQHRSSATLLASTASRPALMTLRNAPLWDRTAIDMDLIWVGREGKYFCWRGWTGMSLICPSGKSVESNAGQTRAKFNLPPSGARERDAARLAEAAGNDDKNDHRRGEEPGPLPLLSVREQGDHDDHENTEQREHALCLRGAVASRWRADHDRKSAQ